MRQALREDLGKRLARIEGQVRGLAGMVEADRYCIDVVLQIQAARAALAKVESLVLADHVDTCVQHALEGADAKERRAKVDELLKVLAPGQGR
jgi:DNA-binding FrmR family transcriptional regulator